MRISHSRVLLFAVVFLANATAAIAQAEFRISPPVADVTVGRGGTKVFSLELSNDNKEKPLRFRIFAMDADMDREGATNFLEAGSSERSCSPWLEIEPVETDIAPGQTKKINVKLSVPASAAAGGYYGAVVCELVPRASLTPDSGAKIRWRIASLLKATVLGGTIERKAQITDLAVRTLFAREAQEARGITFVASLQNQGNIHIQASGKLTLLTPERSRKGEVDFDVGTGTILPGHVRDFTAVYDKLLAEGEYIARATFRYGGTATLEKEIPVSIKTGSGAGEKGETILLPSLKVIPQQLQLKIPAGGFRTAGLVLQNQRQQGLRVELSLGEGTLPKEWLVMEPSSLLIEAGREAKVLLKANVPAEATAQAYKTKLVFSSFLQGEAGEERLEASSAEIELEVPNL